MECRYPKERGKICKQVWIDACARQDLIGVIAAKRHLLLKCGPGLILLLQTSILLVPVFLEYIGWTCTMNGRCFLMGTQHKSFVICPWSTWSWRLSPSNSTHTIWVSSQSKLSVDFRPVRAFLLNSVCKITLCVTNQDFFSSTLSWRAQECSLQQIV